MSAVSSFFRLLPISSVAGPEQYSPEGFFSGYLFNVFSLSDCAVKFLLFVNAYQGKPHSG